MREPLKFRSAEEKRLWVQAYAAAQAHGSLNRADRIADNAIFAYRERLTIQHKSKRGDVKARVKSWFEANPSTEASVNDVGKAIGKAPDSLRSTLHRLKINGFLCQPQPGLYKLNEDA